MRPILTTAALLALVASAGHARDPGTELDHEPDSLPRPFPAASVPGGVAASPDGVPAAPLARDQRPTVADGADVDDRPDAPVVVGDTSGDEDEAHPVPAYEPREEMTLAFIFHVDEGLAEQDVFHEREPGSGEVFRPTGATRDMDAPFYAPAVAVPHTPLQTENVGPWPRGEALGFTLGEWFAAEGSAVYACEDGEGHLEARFENLVPGGLYTLWHDFAVWPPTDPFPGFYDLPFGARDGSENAFRAEEDGSAELKATIKPCPQLSGEQLISELAIAYHSDDETHGASPGTFSTDTHVQLYVTLPKRTGF